MRWYDRHKRDLPWRRRGRDAYAQLLAEFMLQQTQVSTVLPYYERFMKRFPTVGALAAADLDDVLALWSGLGYYRRARHLHAAASQIVRRHDGRVPDTVDELMALPGIGRYTAGAIASVAYDVRAPVLDGNVARVLSRLLALRADLTSRGQKGTGTSRRAVSRMTRAVALGASPVLPRPVRTPAAPARLWQVAEGLLPAKRCGDFNQALMELGATICSPRSPQCPACPLARECRARARGLTDSIPPVAKRARVTEMRMVVVAVCDGEHLLFEQRGESSLWAGLWELPSEALVDGENIAAALRRLRKRLPAGVRLNREPLPPVIRVLTHRRITFHPFAGHLPGSIESRRPGTSSGQFRWLQPGALGGVGVSNACRAILVSVNML